jgi:PAS domain S-box-containing protein
MALHQARHRAAKSEATVEQAQGKLRDADDRQVAVNEVKEFAIFQIDPTGHISTWNQGAHRLFGFQDDEAIGQPTDILFTPEDRAQGEPARELNTARVEGRASDDRWQLRKDGTRFWASGVTTALHDEAGNPRGFTKVCRDLTTTMLASDERERLLKSEQQARHEAVMATQMKDQFLSVVSHELRTPLTAILLWVKILRAGTMEEKERAAALETIERSATAQGQLIEDLLDVSRIISGKLRLNVRPTELVTFVRAAIESVRPMADVKGVAVNAQIPEGTGLVYADPDRIQQVIWNLLTNAVKFTDKGGRVDARLDRFDETLRITITDTGRGIEPEFLPHVFDPFQQAEHATRRREGGLGLGLAIARQLVQLHGGTIEATSAGLGKGSTFTVLLPLATVLSR